MQRQLDGMMYGATYQRLKDVNEAELNTGGAYTKPTLMVLGDIRGLTMGSTGKFNDGVNSKRPTP